MDPDHRKRFGSYHKNHGEGMDNYKVGTSRGTGGIAQFAKGEWARSINWAEQKVVMTGPVRAVFELIYSFIFSAIRRRYEKTQAQVRPRRPDEIVPVVNEE